MDAEIALENEALLAIYSEEIQFRSERDCLYNYNVPQNQLLNVSIALKRGDSYPDEVPSIQVLSNGESIDKLQVAMLNKAEELKGTVMIFDLLTFAQDWLADNHATMNDPPIREEIASQKEKVIVKMSEEQREELSRSELIESSEKPLLASREIPDRPQVDSIAFTPEELVQVQQEEVVRLAEILSVPRGVAQMLFNHFKWRSDKVIARYLSYPKEALEESGLNVMALNKSTSIPISSCELCMTDELEPDDVIHLETCNHAFCKDCYRSYVTLKIREEGASHNITCAGYQCKTVISQDIVKRLVDKPTYKMYSILLLKNYVDSNPYLRWCPGKYCRYSCIVKSEFLYNNCAKCSCGYASCFECGSETHAPATCDMLGNFTKSSRLDEEKSLMWLKTNTKLCPQCKVFIQKNEGCNHMTCRRCRYEFCWVCNGPWKDHTGFYMCNRPNGKVSVAYDDETKKRMDDSAYYNHHYIRFENHQRSKSFAEKMVKVLHNTLQRHKNPLFEYGLAAANQLVLCRQILSCSYAFGFFFPKEKDRDMFDYLQQELEQTTENFSMQLERWFRRPTSTPPSLLINHTNASQLRINALLDHVKYDLSVNDVERERRREKIDVNLSVIPERVPPSEEEIKLQQKVADLKLSRELKLSAEIISTEQNNTNLTKPNAIKEVLPETKNEEERYSILAKKPTGVVFREVCTNIVNGSYDIVPDEMLSLLPNIVYLKQKYDVTAILTTEGDLWMFGNNECGQCGNFIEESLRRRIPQRVQLPMGERVKQVDFGEFHTVVLTEKGNVYAWGQVSNGKLGYEIAVLDQISTSQQAYSRLKPYLVKFDASIQKSQISKIACGRNHTICLDSIGRVWGFGSGSFGQLATGEDGNLDMMVPGILPQLVKHHVVDIGAGAGYSLALTATDLYLMGSTEESEPNAYARKIFFRHGYSMAKIFASEHSFSVHFGYYNLLAVYFDRDAYRLIDTPAFWGKIFDVVVSNTIMIATEHYGLLKAKDTRAPMHIVDYPARQFAKIAQVSNTVQPMLLVTEGLGKMSSNLSQAFTTGMTDAFSDLKFIVQHEGITREFLVNKVILAARSEYFKKLFASDPKLAEIPVKGVPLNEFRLFLLFIYCDSVFETTIKGIDFDILAKLAARYKFSFLEEQCYFMMGVKQYVTYSTLAKQVGQIQTMEEFSDIEIKVQDKTYKLHKFILSARCPYFRNMLNPGSFWKEGAAKVIALHDIECSTFEQLLGYIYSDTMTFADDGVVEVAEIFVHAHEFCLETVQTFSESVLMRLINKTNVCQLLTLGSLYGRRPLLNACLSFIKGNFTSITKASFNELSDADKQEIYKSTGRKV